MRKPDPYAFEVVQTVETGSDERTVVTCYRIDSLSCGHEVRYACDQAAKPPQYRHCPQCLKASKEQP